MKRFLKSLAVLLVVALAFLPSAYAVELLNVSYDPTRELFQQYNAAFAKHWAATHPDDDAVKIKMSHGGSGKQARSVVEGNEADIVTLALSLDIDLIAKAKLTSPDWQKRLPGNSSPYTSTIVFVVRKGNPKGIKDWNDLAKAGVSNVAANPKTGGGARWIYLAAWGFALKQPGGTPEAARSLVTNLYHNSAVLDSGARGTTTSFAKNGVGDVELAWENEARLILKEFPDQGFEIILPSKSILAQPSVAVVDSSVERHDTKAVAEEYLNYLYSPEGQDIIARNYYRPIDPKTAAKYKDRFPQIELFTIDDVFGGWEKAQKEHFDNGAIFDQIMNSKPH